jgi:hypothetical protein
VDAPGEGWWQVRRCRLYSDCWRSGRGSRDLLALSRTGPEGLVIVPAYMMPVTRVDCQPAQLRESLLVSMECWDAHNDRTDYFNSPRQVHGPPCE